MKFGFLLALATTIAVTSAQSPNYAGAQANAEAWSGSAPAKGFRVISVPSGSIIHRQSGSGNPQTQVKLAHAIANARVAAGQLGQPASRAPKAGHAANPQAVYHGKSRPQSHHPGHRAPHHAVPQPAKPQIQPANTTHTDVELTTTTPTHAAAVTVGPQLFPSNQNLQNSSQPFQIPDLGELALSYPGDLPQDFVKVLHFALTNSLLAKTASGVVTTFLTAQSTNVPEIIAGIHKGLTDAANVISPENVKKAVDTLTDKSQDAFKIIITTLAELAVSQADKMGDLIKSLVQARQLAQTIAICFSVITTIGLIIQNEVLPHIPYIDFSHLPILLDKLPIPLDNLDKFPVSLDKLPIIPLDNLPIPLDKLPITLNKLSIPLNKLPISLDKLPISLDKLPISLDKLPISLDKLPISLDKLPISIDKILDLFGHKPPSAIGDVEIQASPSNTQGEQVAAKALSTAKAVATAPDAATAEAQSAVVTESLEYFGYSEGEYDPLSIAG